MAWGIYGFSQAIFQIPFGMVSGRVGRKPIMTIGLLIFAAGNMLAAVSHSSKLAPANCKGTAMGIYYSCQFLGIYIGGAVEGWVYGRLGLNGAFGFSALAALGRFLAVATMKNPRYLSKEMLDIGMINEDGAALLANRLAKVPGVAEAVVVAEDGIAYLKVDKHLLDTAALRESCLVEG